MYRRLIGASLSLALLALLSFGDVSAQEKNKKAMVPKDSETLTPREYTGTLKTTINSDRTFTVNVETKKRVPIPRAGRGSRPPVVPGVGQSINRLNSAIVKVYAAQAKYLQAVGKLSTARSGTQASSGASSVNKAYRALQSAVVSYQNAAVVANIKTGQALGLALGANGLYRIEVSKQDYDFQAIETPKVRIMNLPEQFDDKGNPKKYTEKEKQELKGKDKNLPGYESQPEKLEAGQRVRVTLVTVPKKKPAAEDKAKKDADKDANDKDKDKDKDKEKDNKDPDGEKKVQVKMIVILEEADANKGKKKKKNDN